MGPYKEPEYPDELVTLEIVLQGYEDTPVEVTYSTGLLRRVASGDSMTPQSVLYALTGWNLEDPPGTPLPLTWGRLPLQLGYDIARGVLIDAAEHVRGWRGYQGG